MGRPGGNDTQHHQGLPQDVSDVAPPPPLDGVEPNGDLYGPPSDHYEMPPPVNNSPKDNNVQPPQSSVPQAFPPSQPTAAYHQPNVGIPAFPPSQPTAAYQPPMPMGHHPAVSMSSPTPFMPTPQLQNQLLPTQAWKTGLFDCMQDPQNAIITACFPCITFGQIAEIADYGTTSCATSGMWYSLIAFCIAMPCIMSCSYRSKMRARFGLIESPAPDCLVHFFCEHCALCQEYRELKERGFDPSIGWLGNVAMQQQKQQVGMAPPMQQRMM